jgi:hypothetical protein
MLLSSDAAFLFRKPPEGPKWEYKAVNKESPLHGKQDEVEAYTIILDRMADDGYVPCAVLYSPKPCTLFKRAKDVKPVKAEFQLVENVAGRDRVDALNKHGSEGWEWCVGSYNWSTAAVLRKTPAKWEYKLLKVEKSPLTQQGNDAAAFTLILEGVEAKGWTPCDFVGIGILLKREIKQDKKDNKD